MHIHAEADDFVYKLLFTKVWKFTGADTQDGNEMNSPHSATSPVLPHSWGPPATTLFTHYSLWAWPQNSFKPTIFNSLLILTKDWNIWTFCKTIFSKCPRAQDHSIMSINTDTFIQKTFFETRALPLSFPKPYEATVLEINDNYPDIWGSDRRMTHCFSLALLFNWKSFLRTEQFVLNEKLFKGNQFACPWQKNKPCFAVWRIKTCWHFFKFRKAPAEMCSIS